MAKTIAYQVPGGTMVLSDDSQKRRAASIEDLRELIEMIEGCQVVSFELTYQTQEIGPVGGFGMDPMQFERCMHDIIKECRIEDGRKWQTVSNDPEGVMGFAGLGTHEEDMGPAYRHVMQCQKCRREVEHQPGITQELARYVLNGGRVASVLVAR